MAAILLIEDDLTFSRILDGFLSKHGHHVSVQNKGKDGLKAFNNKQYDLVLLDYRLPDATGMDLLMEMKNSNPDIPVVIMTSFNDIRTAIKAIKSGALEYITKPVNPDELLMVVKQALDKGKPAENGNTVVTSNNTFVEGKSSVAKQLTEFIRLVAPTNMSVLIQGESGTGKENVARTIHRLSSRSKGPFVAVDCGALSKELAGSELFGHVKGAFTGAMADKMGQFEAAHKGTIFLDEVGNLSYDVQVKLLRAIQERIIQPIGSTKEIKVDVRILTATNDDLAESVRKGTFREDLYHRLNEFKLDVPPLRDRGEDLYEFLNYFREEANRELGRKVKEFNKEVLALFQQYDWPGNLREMRNVIKRAVLLTTGDEVNMSVIPPEMVDGVKTMEQNKETNAPVYDLKALQEAQEREVIIKTLQEVRYNKSKAARILNIDRKTLYLKMEKYGIE
ncbi:sigma-54-dependent transcriptional regulator [Chryseosolibacter indicus]|uniref:Sigma-54 dependent transcriptional regulator n=1 Tax=Chryseosolibacter indicus TaxID=2782351 RepID=A0ABS5VR73_9BACT|nr:sigma-54 dependent transcriptional regulator [Chryseosolibacter indicus]MBT1702511.1 sigma-54 dependent transcriptional regulator [Chryseosolibacter indicus]